MKVKVKNSKGKDTGREVQLPKDIYSINKINFSFFY